MKIIKTKFKNLYLIKPNVYRDKRGYFLETYNELIFKKNLKKLILFNLMSLIHVKMF